MMINPSRVIFTIFGYPIYWYGVLMATGIIVAIVLSIVEAKRKKINEDAMLDSFIVLILSGIIGARLYYVLFEFKNYFGPGIPWWKMFAVWEGGLAIYGAIIGGLTGLFFYARKKKLCFIQLVDVIAPGLVLAQAIGRWGNFFNQEAFGLPVNNPDFLWFPFAVRIDGMHTFNGVVCDVPFHLATFFYESMWCLLVFFFLWFFLRKRAKHDGDVFFFYAMLYGFERMIVEGLRGDSLWLIKDVVRVSQAISVALFIIILLFLIIRYCKEKKAGKLLWPGPLTESLEYAGGANIPVEQPDESKQENIESKEPPHEEAINEQTINSENNTDTENSFSDNTEQ